MLASIVFISIKVIDLDVDLSILTSQKAIIVVSGALLFQLLLMFLAAFIWWQVLSCFHSEVPPFARTTSIFFKANIGKYLPGNIGHFVGRQLMGPSLGMTQSQLAASSVFETGLNLISAVLISLILSGDKLFEVYYSLGYQHSKLLLVVLVGAPVILLILLVISRKQRILAEIFAHLREISFWIRSLVIFILASIQFLWIGALYAFLLQLSIPFSFADAGAVMSASVIAWLIGYIVPGVPGGIGVRESALLLILLHYPPEIILSVAVIQRIITMIVDVFAWIFGLLLGRMTAAKESIPPQPS